MKTKSSAGIICFSIIVVLGISSLIALTNHAHKADERVWPIPDWQSSTPESQGMTPAKLEEMSRWVEESGKGVDSIIIVRHGYIVYERYINPSYGVNSTHLLHSVSKSVTSAIIGVAIDRGLIHLDDKVLKYFPEMTIKNSDPWKEAITVRDLLTMTAGLQWDEWSTSYDSPLNDLYKMRTSSNPYQYLLDKPMEAKPGEKWVYNTGISDLFTEILRRAAGSDFLEFGVENIFEPLNFSRYCWETDYYGRYLGGSTLSLTTREMAKIGYLFLNNGTWNGKTILSQDWVSESVNPMMKPSKGLGYGYQWWSYPELGVYYASGRHEQSIYVSPKLDLVVAITGGVSDELSSLYSVDNTLLNHFILPACGDFTPKVMTYFKNNLTMSYPAGAILRESENGSIHQVMCFFSNEGKIIVFGNMPGYPSEMGQDELLPIFNTLKIAGNQSDYVLGKPASVDSNERKITVQVFNTTVSGSPVEGAIGYWYCHESSRHFFMIYYRVSKISGDEQMIQEFVSCSETINCESISTYSP